MDWTEAPKLVPELDVSNLEASLTFYTRILGFTVLYQRPEEAFACLELEGACEVTPVSHPAITRVLG
ncbi:MAG: VOC family protein [Phenylobacterium sp.]|jgi:catechol 2,3-dioxygenase-like lactoylglutathione lyase family enzyme|uniref:VOC family protein n=1 Tax=Phenylobacterium sp. TaxID=1871053 RepID=UPI00391F67C1